MRLTPVFMLAVIAIAAAIPAALGISINSVALSAAVVVGFALLIERGVPAGYSAFGQAGQVGDRSVNVEQEYKRVQNDLHEVGADLKAYAKDTKEGMSDLSARVLAVEQELVGGKHGNKFAGLAGPMQTVGSMATQNLEDNQAFTSLKEWNIGTCRIKLQAPIKAALTNDQGESGNYMPSDPERGAIVTEAKRPLRLLDVMPSRPTTSDSVEFVQMNSDGEAGEQVLEGDEKASIELDGELKKSEIVTIAAHTTASRQVLSDHSALQAAIDRMIRYKLLSKLEQRIINGTGGQGHIDGLINQGAQFIPTIGQTRADIIGEALVRQADNGYMPNLILMNSLDWFKIQITKSTTDEEYMFGSPTMPVPPSLWNASVVASPSVPEGTALTIDTSFTTVLDREAPSVMLSNSHKDYFTRNLVAILGELRAGLEILDAFAVYKMDLSPSSGA
ncbi:phage major capsid protein [Marinobacter sp. NFXS9]|uniref:phage major capsid protein n=1 Tax=Marinobacter sp. NFXS9 TaxID=2818433 RepID=UPI0032E028C2